MFLCLVKAVTLRLHSLMVLVDGEAEDKLTNEHKHPEVQKVRVILRRSENSFNLLQWWSVKKQILKHKV